MQFATRVFVDLLYRFPIGFILNLFNTLGYVLCSLKRSIGIFVSEELKRYDKM